MPGIPDDINEIFDAIIDAKHPLLTLSVPVVDMVLSGGAAPLTFGVGGIQTGIAAVLTPSAQAIGVALGLRIPKGTRIVNVRVYLHDVNAQPAIMGRVAVGNRAGSSTVIGTQFSAGNGTTQTVTFAALNYTIASTDGPPLLLLETLTNATGTYSIYAVEVDIDRL